EEFCLVSGLKFGVENSTDYSKAKDPIPFRRMVFSSDLDGRPIRGKDLVLLGVEDRRPVPTWILRLANDRVSWDNYPWGSYVWPTLYKHLREANVKRWQPLYASDPTNESDTKSYSIESFAWAFKTWILESFRAATDDYYTHYRRHPRIIAWSSKHKFYRNMLKPMLHPGTSNWRNPMTSRRQDAEILDPHMDPWIQILIRERTENANWTLAKSGIVCLHPENNRFMILTDPHNIGTLDGSVRHFPSWNDVTWKKNVVVTSDPLALIAEKTKVCKSKEKVVVSSNSEGSDANDFSELKKITALLAKAFNRRKFYSKPTNNNLRTSSTSQSA
nr:hypothetical protein [Tanacetum cinerariifolium]